MQLRPLIVDDLILLNDIDGTSRSSEYLHIERTGEGLSRQFLLEPRPAREPRTRPALVSDQLIFQLKQLIGAPDQGLAIVAEHDEILVGLTAAETQVDQGILQLIDIRVDTDFRRQGVASAMLFQIVQHARSADLRAVRAEPQATDIPLRTLLARLGFELAGLDTHRQTNHDLVKENATLAWYLALD